MGHRNNVADWYDAVLRIRFDSDELIEALRERDGIDDPSVDDILIEIDGRLVEMFGSQFPSEFVVFDSNGEEW